MERSKVMMFYLLLLVCRCLRTLREAIRKFIFFGGRKSSMKIIFCGFAFRSSQLKLFLKKLDFHLINLNRNNSDCITASSFITVRRANDIKCISTSDKFFLCSELSVVSFLKAKRP
jgi:hypothetical protein